MTATLQAVTAKTKPEQTTEAEAAMELVRQDREHFLSLANPDGQLKQLTKTVLETPLNEEMTEHSGTKARPSHLGVGQHPQRDPIQRGVDRETGQVEVDFRELGPGRSEPRIVKKRQRRLGGVDEIAQSLYAKGLTTGEIR